MAADEDIDLFHLFANRAARKVMEALLQRPARQEDLCRELGLKKQIVGPAIARLETAGLVFRTTPRGAASLVNYEAVAELLEREAKLAQRIQDDRAERAKRRHRKIRKDRMSGGAERDRRHSA